MLFNSKVFKKVNTSIVFCSYTKEALPREGGGVNYVAHLNFKTSRVGIYKINACRLLSALPSLSQFGRGRLSLVTISFYALSLLFGPRGLLEFTLAGPH